MKGHQERVGRYQDSHASHEHIQANREVGTLPLPRRLNILHGCQRSPPSTTKNRVWIFYVTVSQSKRAKRERSLEFFGLLAPENEVLASSLSRSIPWDCN